MLTKDAQTRIDLLKSALTGADKHVYEWAAKFVHAEAVISLIPLPCCTPITYVVPTAGAATSQKKKTKLPLWIPIKDMGKMKKGVGVSGSVVKGAHVQFKKKATSKMLYEGIVISTSATEVMVLSDGGNEVPLSYVLITHIDAHNPGKPQAGFSVTYPDKYKS